MVAMRKSEKRFRTELASKQPGTSWSDDNRGNVEVKKTS